MLLRSLYLSDYWAAIFGRLYLLFRLENLDVPRWVRLRFSRRKTTQIRSKSGSPTSLLNINSLVGFWSIVHREWIRFFRQRGRVVATLVTPILFWGLLSSGATALFSAQGSQGGESLLTYFFPGTILLTVLFSSVFSNISTIEDRNQGFLQGVLVSPVGGLAIASGKIVGGALIGSVQATLLVAIYPLLGLQIPMVLLLEALLTLFVVSILLSAIGFVFAWWFDSVQAFHSVMNLILFPLWLLSGAFFPAETAPAWIRPIMLANPLSAAIHTLRYCFSGGIGPVPSMVLCLLSLGILSCLILAISSKMVEQGSMRGAGG